MLLIAFAAKIPHFSFSCSRSRSLSSVTSLVDVIFLLKPAEQNSCSQLCSAGVLDRDLACRDPDLLRGCWWPTPWPTAAVGSPTDYPNASHKNQAGSRPPYTNSHLMHGEYQAAFRCGQISLLSKMLCVTKTSGLNGGHAAVAISVSVTVPPGFWLFATIPLT